MTSKSSFLVSMKENNKRRLWVWVVSALVFLLGYPVLTAFMLNTIARGVRETFQGTPMGMENILVQQYLHERLSEGVKGWLGFSEITFIVVTLIAVVSAVQGFFWLYSRKKTDFYLGMPVKRKKRFLVIWLDGILLWALPYLGGLAASMVIAAASGAMDKTVFATVAASFGVSLCFYLGVYHLAMLAVMLTGNIVVTGFGFLVFCFYELAVRIMVMGYKDLFFKYFSYYGQEETPMLSPFSLYLKLAETFNLENLIDIKDLALLLGVALVLGVLSYLCYCRRPAEAAGKAMVFAVTKPVVKILLVVVATLLAGLVVSDVADFDPQYSAEGIGWVLFAMLLVAVIGSALIQVIYEFDLRGILHQKLHIVLGIALSGLVFLSFQYDVFGYDSYVPETDKVESVAFIPEYYEEINRGAHFDSEGKYMSGQEYAADYMYLKNTEEICELAKASMEGYNKLDRSNHADRRDEEGKWAYCSILYRLKGGREVSRVLWVNVEDERTAQLLDTIIGSEEFKKGYIACASDNIDKMMEDTGKYKVNANYGNLVYKNKMSNDEAGEFLEIYRKDLAAANFTNIRENVPVGVFEMEIAEKSSDGVSAAYGYGRSTRSWGVSATIYPFYKESIAFLTEHGLYMDSQIDLADVEKIQVVNNNYEKARELQKKQDAADGMGEDLSPEDLLAIGAGEVAIGAEGVDTYDVDTRIYADYTDMGSMEEIAACVYPRNLIVPDWDYGKELDDDFEVIVYFKTDSEMTRNYGTSASYGFLEGEVPGFVKEDTVYK